jgi:Glycosyl hydrolase family 57
MSTRLHLYTAFHANLKFSSIPANQYSAIISRCFWPVVEMLDQFPDIRLGFEFPGETLEIVESYDPEFLEAVRSRWHAGRCEVLASGYAQSILPLVPAGVNARNLELGDQVYERIFGRRPAIAYVNEQTYSSGTLGLYAERGYRAIIADWDNTVAYNRYPNSYRYFPQRAVGDGVKLPVIWNSSIAFQKFQRYLGGELDLDDYVGYLASQWSPEEDRAFLLYGNDWEIIDYKPGQPLPLRPGAARLERDRLSQLFERLSGDERFALDTPSQVLDRFPPKHDVHLESSEYPIPCKKQDKYNVTRWAVCGREATLMNTQCHELEQAVETVHALEEEGGEGDAATRELDRRLISLWGSDYRTYVTQEKYVAFRNDMGAALSMAGETVKALSSRAPAAELSFYNPNSVPWEGVPHEFLAEFGAGEAKLPVSVSIGGRVLPTQLEDVELRSDGSLRRARVVICPTVPPRSWITGKFVSERSPAGPAAEIGSRGVTTREVRATFNPGRGATLRELAFPNVAPEPLAATLPHGYFESVGLSPDWYTGGITIFDQFNRKVTDLVAADLVMPDADKLADYPIRIPVRCKIDLPTGSLWKTANVYRDSPRLDITYHFRLMDLQPHSFRVGTVTVNPAAFERTSMSYLTVNGGREPEHYVLSGHRVVQDEPVSLNVSSRHCLGATEGWVAVSDGSKGLAVLTNKAECYSVPLIHFEEVEDSFFLRIYTSLAESDETSAQIWRGHSQITVRYLGFRGNVDGVRREGVSMNGPLVTQGACIRSGPR